MGLAGLKVEQVGGLRDLRDDVVQHVAGVRHELADDLGADAPASAADKLGHDIAHLVGTIAFFYEPLRVERADIVAQLHPGSFRLDFQHGHLRAFLSRGKRSLHAGVAAAAHHHIVILRLGNVALVYDRLLAQPVLCTLIPLGKGSGVRRVAGASAFFGLRGAAASQRGAACGECSGG